MNAIPVPRTTEARAAVGALVKLQGRYPILQLAGLVALFLYGAGTIPGFADEQSVRSMLVLAALLGLAAAGQTLVMIIGGLDLSIPGFIALGAILVSELCGSHGWSLGPAVLLITVFATALGGTTGWLCHRLLINPLVLTLGVGAIAVGGCLVWTKGELEGAAPTSVSDLVAANGTTFGLPVSPVVVIWGIVAILLGVVLHRTPIGRQLYATGANPRAAELAMVPTRRIWVYVFVASAVMSALVGVMLAGFSGADQSLGDPYLFQGLTAVIVGGTAFMGARGDYWHTAIGALILTELTTILVGNGYELADQQIIYGILILVVVAGYGRRPRLRDSI
jgi:ribose transport system permease protein